jgi:hypothetical protein
MTKIAIGCLEELAFHIEMAPGHVYAVPLMAIALDRARNYADEFEGDVQRSLAEDTLPLFASDLYEAEDWRGNNMNWADVKEVAVRVETKSKHIDFDEGWINGRVGITGKAGTVYGEDLE